MFTFGLLPLPEPASYILMAIAVAILWTLTSRPHLTFRLRRHQRLNS